MTTLQTLFIDEEDLEKYRDPLEKLESDGMLDLETALNQYGDINAASVDAFSYDEQTIRAVTALVNTSRALFVTVLKQEEFKALLHSALFGVVDIESMLRSAFTSIKHTCDISDSQWKGFHDNLSFLKSLIGDKSILSASSHNRDFREITKKYDIFAPSDLPPDLSGCMRSYIDSLDASFGNADLRADMKFWKWDNTIFVPNLVTGDATSKKSRSHLKISSLAHHLMSLGEVAQNDAYLNVLSYYFGPDDHRAQSYFFKPLYISMADLETNYLDP